ncbi:SDR family NAD(P)-dependent oxidoreductase [Roseibium aggregatum]|uniref:SDR family NAD(P)-dependent oxidoreductase n=1 Tax=Roseibium aggregatum TaxID=187304 RepID=A0A926P2X5_9HYPH|nr:SDR family NAD(P)-dependent oxidoreductase [Roseibium aggregatum]MBD1548128.1 SDR family NAD(P)-dependent oxidoreductase [Roseibium aggregatum]
MKDRIVMVTGASGNLGSAVVDTLRPSCTGIVCVNYSGEATEQLELGADGKAALLTIGGTDTSSPEACQTAVDKCLAAFGRLDGLVNTVGGFGMGPVDDDGIALWEKFMSMNAKTAYCISAAVLKPMQEAGFGRIVHIAAAPGLKAGARQAAYAASKSAVIRLTEAIAAENRKHGISANCILPGTIDTPQNREAMPDANTDTWVKPESIARLIAFLMTPEGGVTTGGAIPATGKV